jgi:uncharacterized membrane protein YoaK (UPF0700 family)
MNFYYLVGNNMFKNILKNQIALIIISLLMFVLGFINVIANIMNWQINEVLDYVKLSLSILLLISSSISLNTILENKDKLFQGINDAEFNEG